MNNDNINLFEYLSIGFNNIGYPCETDGKSFSFTPLNLKFDIEIEETIQLNNETIHCRLKVKCFTDSISKQFTEFATGWGASKEDAIQNAIDRWIESDFYPIHDLLCQSPENTKNIVEVASFSGTRQEFLGWNVILGPFLLINNSTQDETEDLHSKIFWLLFDDLSNELLAEPDIYPIRCFISRNKDSIDIDCRINGVHWQSGYETLYDFVYNNWDDAEFKAWKQYFIIRNVNYDEIKSESLKEALLSELAKQNKEVKKPWWKIW